MGKWERVNKYRRQEENNVDYFSTGNWYMTNEAMETNPYWSRYGRNLTFRDYLILKFDPNRLSNIGSKRNIYIKFYRWLSRRNKSSRRLGNLHERERIHKYGPGWVAMPALTELGFERQKVGWNFETVFTDANGTPCDFSSFNRNMKLEIKLFQGNFSCFIKSGEGRGYEAQYGINLSKIFNGYDDGSADLWGLKRMILMNFIPSSGHVTWGGGIPYRYFLGGAPFKGNYSDYNQRHSVIIGLQLEYRDPNTSEVTTISPLLPFRVYVYSNNVNDGNEDIQTMFEKDIKIDIIPFNKGYI